jgi:putative tryptophan/tyrosine transport system substrate-binding protein
VSEGLEVTRRQFIALVGCAVVAWPFAAHSQQPAIPVIGFLSSVSFESYANRIAAFRQGLKETGFVEGNNVTFANRSAEGQVERLPAFAAELVRQQVAVIVTIGGDTPAKAAKEATSTIPIVFATGSEALDVGLVTSLNRPEANATGVSFFSSELAPKRLELLRDLLPQASLVAFLDGSVGTTKESFERYAKGFELAARNLGLRSVTLLGVDTELKIDRAFANMVQQRVSALVVSNDAYLNSRRAQIVASAARHAIPAMYPYREQIAAGGLISYGTDVNEMYRQAGIYAGRILKGAKPGDLPVLSPTKFELLINLKTAKVLGLTVPPSMLARADEVIE